MIKKKSCWQETVFETGLIDVLTIQYQLISWKGCETLVNKLTGCFWIHYLPQMISGF